jgi:hypothetical protein
MTRPPAALKEAIVKLNSSWALVAAGILALGTAAYGDDAKRTDTDTQKPGDALSPSGSKHISKQKKRAGKRQQIQRGAGPVGDEGAQGAQSSDLKTPDLSPGTGLEPSATQQKAGKRHQLRRGAGPVGNEGATSGTSSETTPQHENMDKGADKGDTTAPQPSSSKEEKQ